MKMKWFGKTWHSPLNDDCEQTETPTGETCMFCPVIIREGDRGVVIASVTPPPYPDLHYEPAHLLCFMQETIGGMLARRVYNMLAEREGF